MDSNINKTFSIPAIIMVAGIFFSCHNTIEEIDTANDTSELPLQTIYGGFFDYTEKGKLLQRISAGEMNQYKSEDLVATNGVKVQMYDADEVVEAVLTSLTGTYRKEQNTLTARDSVKLVNAEGDVLMTKELTLYQDSNLIKTDFPIEIHKGDNVIFGQGLVAESNFSSYRIINPARSRIVIKEDSIN